MNAAMTAMGSQMRRVTNWRGWLLGAYVTACPQAIGKIVDFLATNGFEKTGLGLAQGGGLSVKQLFLTFLVSLCFNTLLFVQKHPLPDTIEQPVTPPPFQP